jgi:hypothetical protein|tara:strand:- start:309 stop:515 length:207 start_codon:yes stop_codon:yes gene_type:complete
MVVHLMREETTMKYYLTEIPETYSNETRLAILTKRMGDVQSVIEAESFLDAKVKFGFELTPIQSDLYE